MDSTKRLDPADPQYRSLAIEMIRAEGIMFDPRPKPARAPERQVVYYILWGDRIKIGATKRLAQRMSALYHDELLAAEPGYFSLENQRHLEFRDYRIPGQREWFQDAPALRFHVNTLRDRYPELIRGKA